MTDAEEMVEEDGKYYPMMRVHYEPGAAESGQMPVQNDTGHMPESNGTNHMPENNGTSQKLENSGIIEADCRRENHRTAEADQKRQEVFFLYGRQLLEKQHPVLREFLQKEQRLYQNILEGLKRQPQTELIIARRQAIKAALKQNKEALHFLNEVAIQQSYN